MNICLTITSVLQDIFRWVNKLNKKELKDVQLTIFILIEKVLKNIPA